MPSQNSPAEIIKRVHQPIAIATGLPNSCYTTMDDFINDRDNVMATAWACIGFADQLPEPNYSIPLDFMGLPLLVTRDVDDIIRVFHNVCSHRGMHLSDKPCKNNGSVRCPYHAWTYALDGQLRGTPNIGGYGVHTHPDFNNADNGLKEVRATTWLGAIFVNLSGDAIPFDEYIAPITRRWEERFTPAADWSQFLPSKDASDITLTVDSNWKLAVENFLESYHLPTVHPELNKISPLEQHYNVDYFSDGAGQGTLNYTRITVDDKSLPSLENWPEERACNAEYPVLYPNTMLGIHADQLFILMLQPMSPEKTVEHARIFYVGEEALEDKYQAHRSGIIGSWEKVFKEDVFAVERMQKGRTSPAYEGGAFSPAMDEPTHHFHKWVANKLDRQRA